MPTWKRPSTWGDAVVLAIVALLLRLVVCFWAWDSVPPTADGAYYHIVAERIAQGNGYTWLWPDGVVTYAAHYPVGYPALMALIYWVTGPLPGAVMVLNATIGAVGVWAAHGLAEDLVRRSPWSRFSRQGSGVAALALALSPTLIAYTPALMTEGAVGAFLVLAARIGLFRSRTYEQETGRTGSKRARVTRGVTTFLLILCVAVAVLLRPQSILLAPLLGWLSSSKSLRNRSLQALIVSAGCMLAVSPWTLRNCDKMERCVFVSANGGWNLLIGTFPEGRGSWVALEGNRVPSECREVYQEAEKDRCFGSAGVRKIFASPLSWIRLVPSKLRATFDYSAAATEYLSSAGALPDSRRTLMMSLEYMGQRMMLLLLALGAWAGCHSYSRKTVHLLGIVGAIGFGGLSVPLGWIASLLLFAGDIPGSRRLGVLFALCSVVVTGLIHGLFFGAGRYSLPLLYAVAPLSALGAAWLCKFLPLGLQRAEDFDT